MTTRRSLLAAGLAVGAVAALPSIAAASVETRRYMRFEMPLSNRLDAYLNTCVWTRERLFQEEHCPSPEVWAAAQAAGAFSRLAVKSFDNPDRLVEVGHTLTARGIKAGQIAQGQRMSGDAGADFIRRAYALYEGRTRDDIQAINRFERYGMLQHLKRESEAPPFFSPPKTTIENLSASDWRLDLIASGDISLLSYDGRTALFSRTPAMLDYPERDWLYTWTGHVKHDL